MQLPSLAQASQAVGPVQGQVRMSKGRTESRMEETSGASESYGVPMRFRDMRAIMDKPKPTKKELKLLAAQPVPATPTRPRAERDSFGQLVKPRGINRRTARWWGKRQGRQ